MVLSFLSRAPRRACVVALAGAAVLLGPLAWSAPPATLAPPAPPHPVSAARQATAAAVSSAAPISPSAENAPFGAARQPVAAAQDPDLAATGQAQAQIYLLEQQIKRAHLELDLARAKTQLRDLNAALAQSEGARGVIDVAPSAPAVLSIQGGAQSGGLMADLRFPDQTIQRVRAGDPIEGGWSIASITPAQVVLAKPGSVDRILPLRLRAAGDATIQAPLPAPPAIAMSMPDVPRLITTQPAALQRPGATAATAPR